MPTPDWVPLLTLGANIGFSVVVAWYLIAKAIPSMQDRFDRALKEQREDDHAAMAREREVWTAVLKIVQDEERGVAKDTHDKVSRILLLLEDHVRQGRP